MASDKAEGKRKDALAKAADELNASGEAGNIDPNVLEVDREIRQILDLTGLEVSNPKPDYHYAWVYRDPYNRFGGRFVMQLKVLGWEIVSASDQEAREHTFADGTRVIGDVVLLRIQKDRFRALQIADVDKRRRQQHVTGVTGDLQELAAKHGVPVHTQLNEQQLKRAQARSLAAQKLDKAIRTGTVPGLSLAS